MSAAVGGIDVVGSIDVHANVQPRLHVAIVEVPDRLERVTLGLALHSDGPLRIDGTAVAFARGVSMTLDEVDALIERLAIAQERALDSAPAVIELQHDRGDADPDQPSRVLSLVRSQLGRWGVATSAPGAPVTAARVVVTLLDEGGETRWHRSREDGYTAYREELGAEYVGTCEFCGWPVFDDDRYAVDEDGVYWHATETLDGEACPPPPASMEVACG